MPSQNWHKDVWRFSSILFSPKILKIFKHFMLQMVCLVCKLCTLQFGALKFLDTVNLQKPLNLGDKIVNLTVHTSFGIKQVSMGIKLWSFRLQIVKQGTQVDFKWGQFKSCPPFRVLFGKIILYICYIERNSSISWSETKEPTTASLTRLGIHSFYFNLSQEAEKQFHTLWQSHINLLNILKHGSTIRDLISGHE